MNVNHTSRYEKQMKVSYIGSEAQQKLFNSHVTIVGLGALGSAVAEQLTRSGVGKITLIDRDYVDLSNLQRQSLYTEHDVQNHLPKAMAAFNRLSAINSTISLKPVIAHLGANNISELLDESDLVIDATDNLRVRYLINEYAVRQNKPWIHGAVASTYGRVMTFIPNITPCFRCVYPYSPELDTVDTCDTVGVLGSIVSVIGSYQVTEALKWLTGNEQFISTAMVEINVWTQQTMKLDLASAAHKNCPVCVQHRYELLDHIPNEFGDEYTVLCGRQTIQTYNRNINKQNFEKYVNKFKGKPNMLKNKFLCKFEHKHCVITLFPDGRCLIQGLDQIDEAAIIMSELFDY